MTEPEGFPLCDRKLVFCVDTRLKVIYVVILKDLPLLSVAADELLTHELGGPESDSDGTQRSSADSANIWHSCPAKYVLPPMCCIGMRSDQVLCSYMLIYLSLIHHPHTHSHSTNSTPECAG